MNLWESGKSLILKHLSLKCESDYVSLYGKYLHLFSNGGKGKHNATPHLQVINELH